MEEIDIQTYLVLKKEGEDGPDVKGGQLEALIVHASKVQKVSESGKCYACWRYSRSMDSIVLESIASRTHNHIYSFFLFP